MKLQQVLQIINEEESDPEKIAKQIIKVINDAINFGSISNIDIILDSEINRINGSFYPNGSKSGLDLKSKSEIDNFIQIIITNVQNLKISKPKFYEMVLKKIENFKQKLLEINKKLNSQS